MARLNPTKPIIAHVSPETHSIIQGLAKKHHRTIGKELTHIALGSIALTQKTFKVPLSAADIATLTEFARASGRTVAEEFVLRTKGAAEEAFAAALEASPDLNISRTA